MTFNASFSTPRSAAVVEFWRAREQARMSFLRARLFVRPARLDSFDAVLPLLLPGRRYLGNQEVSLAQVTGSVGRCADFDRNFHPLKSHLRDRWVRVYLLSQQAGWAPVRVYKVGEHYFVEDGHHRVSVAHSLGMRSIQAEVWEYQYKSFRVEAACWCCLPA